MDKGRMLSHSDVKSYLNKLETIIPDTIDFKLSEADPNLANQVLENHPDIINE